MRFLILLLALLPGRLLADSFTVTTIGDSINFGGPNVDIVFIEAFVSANDVNLTFPGVPPDDAFDTVWELIGFTVEGSNTLHETLFVTGDNGTLIMPDFDPPSDPPAAGVPEPPTAFLLALALAAFLGSHHCGNHRSLSRLQTTGRDTAELADPSTASFRPS